MILSKITAALVDSDNIIHDIDEALHTLNNEKIYDEATLLAVGKRVLITVVQSRLADNGNEIQFAANDEVGVKQVLDDRVHKILGKACNPFDAEKFHQKHRNPKLDYWSGITLTATTKKMVMDLGEQLLKELLQAVDQVESSGQKLQILREAKHHWLFSNNYSTTWIATGNGRTPAMKVLDNKIAGLQAPVELGIPLIAGWKNPLRMGVVR